MQCIAFDSSAVITCETAAYAYRRTDGRHKANDETLRSGFSTAN